ncbi:SUMF1/EgtB/PvdO family nonheme iron enzyme [Paraburkholderia dipogonis]|uniref:SUMF1/EgtB/PvdO family nonheme iron enzyme n=1 Tax=Paraburkholderia dipogonis TaxID=1211383 RepID=UPI0035ECE67E
MVHPSFEPTRDTDDAASTHSTSRHVRIPLPAGTFVMARIRHYPRKPPAHKVRVGGFLMDRNTVTNADFARFVAPRTGHVTTAERPANPEDYPGALPENAGARPRSCSRSRRGRVDLRNHYNWWTYMPRADWRHPAWGRTVRWKGSRTIRSCM